jgi:hypothetical protein
MPTTNGLRGTRVAGSVGPNTPTIGTYSSLLIPQTAPVALSSVTTMYYTALALAIQQIIRLWVVFADRLVKTKLVPIERRRRNPYQPDQPGATRDPRRAFLARSGGTPQESAGQ